MKKRETVKLSASMLGAALGCPACFWRDYNFPLEFHLPGVLGKMDRLEKEYYDKYRNKTPPILRGLIKEKLVDAKMADKLRKGLKYFDGELNAVLSGKMDDCFVNSRGYLVPMDNKTATPKDEKEDKFLQTYQTQLDTYTFLLQKHGYKTTDYGYLIYYTPESGTPDKGIIFRAEPKRLSMHPKSAIKVFKYAVNLVRRPKMPGSHKDCETCLWLKALGV